MDKKSLLAVLIITIVILLLPTYYGLIYDEKDRTPETNQSTNTEQEPLKITPVDTEKSVIPEAKTVKKEKQDTVAERPEITDVEQAAEEKNISIETPLISAVISNRGGGKIISWQLKKYKQGENGLVRIVDDRMNNGPAITFISVDGVYTNLNDFLFFRTDGKGNDITLVENEKITFSFFLTMQGSRIKKDFTVYGNRYHADMDIDFQNSQHLLLNGDYEIEWENGLPSNEQNKVDDYSYSEAYASMGGEIETYSISSEEKGEEKTYNGTIDWIGIRTKYFLSSIIPIEDKTTGVTFSGFGVKTDDILVPKYNPSINVNYRNSGPDRYQIYMGPLDHGVLTQYESGIDAIIMRHGWYEKTFRAISLPILSLLKFFYMFIPNYGMVIIIFSVLVKIVVYPLTKKSYKSMKEMSRVQPLLTELREKYKSDPQRLNKETMKLYKEHGINPLGGCLPMLLQLPLLAALFIVFRSTIQLRGATFIPGWIDDLSHPDTLFTLPFSLPLYGNQFNLLPILMAGSMIMQSKMTMQDPKQKAMVYIMPIFMLVLFNQFPSGLNLYYTLFNVLTIIQQKFTDNKNTPEPVPAGAVKSRK